MNASASKKQAARPTSPAVRVLVVEDSEESARVAATLLETAGYVVQTARNGTEGLVVAETFHPQVVLIDIGLPGLDGLHVARELRKVRHDALLIAITGRSGPEAQQASAEAGFDYHLVKPLDFDKLADLLAAPPLPKITREAARPVDAEMRTESER